MTRKEQRIFDEMERQRKSRSNFDFPINNKGRLTKKQQAQRRDDFKYKEGRHYD